MLLLSSTDIFFKINFLKKFCQKHYQSVKWFDPDQDKHFVGHDLGPNCLHRLSEDDNFVGFGALCPSQHVFSHVGTIFCLPGLHLY